ncbi:hypothetical protein BH18ACT11_BH18ACT11_22270 [soil metagenome]
MDQLSEEGSVVPGRLEPVARQSEPPSQTTAAGLAAAGVSLVWECMRNPDRSGLAYRPLSEHTPSLETALA